MKHMRLSGTTAIALALAALAADAASAAITPEEVWQVWQQMGAAQGQTLTAASTSTEGGKLIAEGVVLTAGDDMSKVTADLGRIEFSDRGDGTVAVVMAESYPMALDLADAGGEGKPVTARLTVSQPGLSVVVSGDVDAPAYSFDAPTMKITLDALEGPGAEGVTASGGLDVSGLSGRYAFATPAGLPMTLQSEFSAKSVALAMAGAEPGGANGFDLKLSAADMTGKSNGAFLDTEAMNDMNAALKAGVGFDVALAYGASSFDMKVTEETKPTGITGTMASGGFNFALDKTRLAYGGSGTGVTMSMSGGDLPVPQLDISYGEAMLDMVVPVSKADGPQDFKLLTRLVDLKLSDTIWNMLDPAGQLPHDPATLIVDTSGTATLSTDLFDEKGMEDLGPDGVPGQFDSVKLAELVLRALGAELTGSGAVTLDNTDLQTYGGMPVPTGTIDLKLVGGNALLDKLVAMGIVSQDDAMGGRMMMSMFAKMVDGQEDTMTSSIEFKDKGVTVNGQRIQ